VVNVITRSGTRNFHGEAYDYIRNDMFDAKPYFLDSVYPAQAEPVRGQSGRPAPGAWESFIFVDYEGTIQHQPANIAPTAIVTATAFGNVNLNNPKTG
jgi:hypothetical protein